MNGPSRTVAVCVTLVVGWVGAAEPSVPPRETVLRDLRRQHPRLFASADDFQRLRDTCGRSAEVGRWQKSLIANAEKLLSKPPVKYEIPDGKRLLAVSRETKERVLLLALVYRLTNDDRYARRAWTELDTVTRFKDWNPPHFLDTAEMTLAVAVGYDWLHDVWTDAQRTQLRQAIVGLGLRPGLPFYREKRGWAKAVHNWNQVCNGGLAVGALAIAEDEPELAGEVVHGALQSVPLAMHEFRPDGGWGEGPGYWRYATEYNVFLLAGLRSALGTDFGLAGLPGFSVTGDFPLHFTSPTGLTFNYADAQSSWKGAPQLFWLATAFGKAEYAAAQIPHATKRPSPLDLLWGADWLARGAGPVALPLDRHFTGVSVVTLRGDWDNPRAVFVGFKGGDNRVNHGHLDLGSFVLDAAGQRWALDLGPDDYNLPGYFGKQRWTYYRNNTHGHNTLLINDEDQSPSARAAVVSFSSSPAWVSAIADLSAAYPRATQVRRGFALIDRRQVLVQDEIEAREPVRVVWQLHTEAKVELADKRAVLTLGGEKLTATILAPGDAKFAVQDVRLDPPQRPATGVRRLAISGTPAMRLQIAVLFAPGDGVAEVPRLRPLREWPVQGK